MSDNDEESFIESLLIKACILAIGVAVIAIFHPVTPAIVLGAMIGIAIGETFILLRKQSR